VTLGAGWDYENKISPKPKFVMEAKKNPEKDIHRKSGMFFQFGLGISVAIVITAFEWTTEVRKKPNRATNGTEIELTVFPPTEHNEPPRPSPIKTEIPITQTKNIQTIEVSSSEPESEGKPEIDQTTPVAPVGPIESDEPEVCNQCIETFPEQAAEPVGGYSAFYSLMRDNMKYPKKARNFEVEGRVFVEFVVNRDGSVVDTKVIKGVGYGCDEEAMRVIGLSKWNPGKQRGRPVRVKMVLPVVFKFQ
jgi:protein TonB